MKKTLLIPMILVLLAACASDKPMDEATRQRLLEQMHGSEAYR